MASGTYKEVKVTFVDRNNPAQFRHLSFLVSAFVISGLLFGCNSSPPPDLATNGTEVVSPDSPDEIASIPTGTASPNESKSELDVNPPEPSVKTPDEFSQRVAQLASDNKAEREAAAAYIEQLGEDTDARLRILLTDSSAEVRRGVLFYFVDRVDEDDQQLFDAYTQALTDKDKTVRHLGLQVIRKMPDPLILEAAPKLMALLDPASETASTRGSILRLVARLKSQAEAQLPQIAKCATSDPDASVRKAGLYAITQIAAPEKSAVFFKRIVESDSDISVQRVAITRLGKLGPAAASAVTVLGEKLVSPDEEIREAAANALVAIGPDAVPTLITRLESETTAVRHLAVLALGSMGNHAKPAVAALRQRLNDPDEQIRRVAAIALRQLGEQL